MSGVLLHEVLRSNMSLAVITRDQEITAVFGRARAVIRVALETHYLVPVGDADEIEQSLYAWFHRFSRRPDSQLSVEALRPNLFRMTCKAAQDYWLWKHHGGRITNDGVRLALNRDPEELAIELEHTVSEINRDKP
jgi:hypothetical protein